LSPTLPPTFEPTGQPFVPPTKEPTEEPTFEPTYEPTEEPTEEPTASPTEPKVEKCTIKNAMWKGASITKNADSATHCYEKCLEDKMPDDKKCKAWTYNKRAKKSCRLYTKSRKTKSKRGTLSGKKNCHPELGKIKN